jgi:rhodanese-related sulfurtransferase
MSTFSLISVQDLHQLVRQSPPQSLQLLDVREPAELAIATLENLGFCNYPLSQYAEWETTLLLELDLHAPTYVICHHGMRSQQMAHWLCQQGFTQVSNISGGIDAWSRQVDPTVPLY